MGEEDVFEWQQSWSSVEFGQHVHFRKEEEKWQILEMLDSQSTDSN